MRRRAVPRLNQNHEHRSLTAFCYNDSFFSIARRCSEHPGPSGFVGFRGSDGISLCALEDHQSRPIHTVLPMTESIVGSDQEVSNEELNGI